jgi:ribosomal-protein-alanine N-acetyltransferase
MSDTLVFRPMSRVDLGVVLAIEQRSFPTPWSRASFEKELATTWAHLTVAEERQVGGERLVGYTCTWRVVDEVQLLNAAVHPACRGRGLGRALVGRVLDEAATEGTRTVLLEVRAGNRVARRLYATLGFQSVRIRRGYYGPGQDAIVMERRLR